MAFKLKTGKTVNKILAGYGIGGIESAIGAIATSVIGSSVSTFTGSNSMGNLQETSL